MKKILILLVCVYLNNCTKKDSSSADIAETAQQVGDVMASVDESGGSSGSLAAMESERKSFAKKTYRAPWGRLDFFVQNYFTPFLSAEATTCKDATTFSSCASNVITRDYNGCTIGGATFTGTVDLTFTDSAVDSTCQMTSAGHSVARNPDFTVTGRRSATLTVSKTGTNGQVITRGSTAGNFTFSNDGIRRVFTLAGTSLFDYTTQTTSDITITGSDRSTRVMSGGTLRVSNNLTSVNCDYTPSTVTWASTCNCAVSGTWTGTCSDSSTSTLTITGCGTATFDMNGESQDFAFDRCYSTN